MIYPCHYPDTLFHINGLHTAFNKHWDSAFDFHGESHDFWEIVTVISGEVEIVEDGKVYILGPSQMICHRPNEFHRIKSAGGTNPNVWIISLIHKGELPYSLGSGIFDLSPEMAEEYATIFSWIFPFVDKRAHVLETTSEENIKARMGLSRLEVFLLTLSQMEGSDRLLSDRISASEYHDLVRTLRKNIHKNLSLEDLSEIHHISKSYIKKLFRTYAGEGAMTYYNRLRIHEIQALIHEGKSAEDITKLMNFSSVSYLSYYFKRETGTNIREYRSLRKSPNE
jgi:AraC-like DNA-binding protein